MTTQAASVKPLQAVDRPRLARRRSRRRTDPSAVRLPRRPLGSYEDATGSTREIVAVRGAARSIVVLDRDASSRADARILAHLAADEPPDNAGLICAQYLAEPLERRHCRALSRADMESPPREASPHEHADMSSAVRDRATDSAGRTYKLRVIPGTRSMPELRWWIDAANEEPGGVLSVREAVGRLESYEPVCRLTRLAVEEHDGSPLLSVATLRAELVRMLRSPLVLNRALRDAVVERVARNELSMSEIAMRCGRIKRDGRGNQSGETSWLARRLGLLPEGGQEATTPWIHSDVLALIARRGLGVSPREVEL